LIADRARQYRLFKSDPTLNIKDQEVIAKLKKIQKAHANLMAELSDLDGKTLMQFVDTGTDVWSFETSPLKEDPVQPPRLLGLRKFERAREALRMFGPWIESAIRTAPPVRRGRPLQEDLVWLVRQLGHLFEARTGAPFSRTDKRRATPTSAEFVMAVLKAELPEETVKNWQVDHLMKLSIAEMGRKKKKSGSSKPR
jgi:hypothetical protein